MKFLGKVASQEGKPDGLLLVPPDRELAFLHSLPVRWLWGVGEKTAEKLRAHGIETVADVAELGESTLSAMVGGAVGHQLYALLHNIDRRRVVTGVRRRPSPAACCSAAIRDWRCPTYRTDGVTPGHAGTTRLQTRCSARPSSNDAARLAASDPLSTPSASDETPANASRSAPCGSTPSAL
jgi:nucleotidyltransferase/DNA polymerase involved in DNA repair